MGAIMPQDQNIQFCRNAIKQGARFVRVDSLPYQRKELLKSLEYVAGKIVKTPKGRILTFRLRFILEVNPNYDPDKDTAHQGI